MLRETENLEEQGDILQYLVDTQGLDFNTGMFKTIINFFYTYFNPSYPDPFPFSQSLSNCTIIFLF